MKTMQICAAEAAVILDWFEAHEDLMRHTASGQYYLAARLANFIGLPEEAAEHRRCAETELAFETMDEVVAEEPTPIEDYEF